MNRLILTIAVMTTVSACGGGGQSTLTPPVLPAMDVVDDDRNWPQGACGTTYYRELAGVYDGQISYSGPVGYTEKTVACVWDVEIELTATMHGSGSCELAFNQHAETISGGAGCADYPISADVYEPLQFSTDTDILNAPEWPVEIAAHRAQMFSGVDVVHAIGNPFTRVSQFGLIMDGRGNITYPNRFSVDGSLFTGVLVKQ